MRLLPVSATRREPSHASVRPRGVASWPGPVPGVPSVATMAPVASKRTTRPCAASLTHAPPAPSDAMPPGFDAGTRRSPPGTAGSGADAGRGSVHVASSLPAAS